VRFNAETDEFMANAREKLIAKDLDAVVANDVSRKDSGFDTENNAIVILVRDQTDPVELPLMSKLEAAHRILDEVVKLRHANTAAKTASGESR
jgi:phosphopantothenoylcysteine decarboxylase/phosphopantothenate--cysteine ligase